MRFRLAYALLTLAMLAPALAQSTTRKPSLLPGDVPEEERKSNPSIGTPKPTDPCAASIVQREGIVTLSLEDAERAGRPTSYTVDDITYLAHFDGTGRLKARGPLFHQMADLQWSGREGTACRRNGIVFNDYQNAEFIALVWPADAKDVALHIVEPPNGRLGGPSNYIYAARPNLDSATGLGRMEEFGESVSRGLGKMDLFGSPKSNASRVQLYLLPPTRNPHDGLIYAFVEFASRGNPAQAPFCGDTPEATVSYKVFHLDMGILGRSAAKFASVACGTRWSGDPASSGYYQMRKWKL